jgi:hypothetical protein
MYIHTELNWLMSVGVLVKKEDVCEFPLTQLPYLLVNLGKVGVFLSENDEESTMAGLATDDPEITQCPHYCLALIQFIVFSVEVDDDSHGLRGDVVGRGRGAARAQVRLDCQVHLVEVDIFVHLLCTGGLGLGNKIGNFSGYLRESRIEKCPQFFAEVNRGRVLPQRFDKEAHGSHPNIIDKELAALEDAVDSHIDPGTLSLVSGTRLTQYETERGFGSYVS